MSKPKERPIVFSGAEVRALLDGRKTQTRRLVHSSFQWVPRLDTAQQPAGITSYYVSSPDGTGLPLRLTHVPAYPGDRLWIREAWALERLGEDGERLVWRADRAALWVGSGEGVHYLESDYAPERWSPSSDMQREHARPVLLDVKKVRVQRLQDISEEDARAEGMALGGLILPGHAVGCFARRWDEINGKSAPWSSNPWVWVLEFKVIKPAPVATLEPVFASAEAT